MAMGYMAHIKMFFCSDLGYVGWKCLLRHLLWGNSELNWHATAKTFSHLSGAVWQYKQKNNIQISMHKWFWFLCQLIAITETRVLLLNSWNKECIWSKAGSAGTTFFSLLTNKPTNNAKSILYIMFSVYVILYTFFITTSIFANALKIVCI